MVAKKRKNELMAFGRIPFGIVLVGFAIAAAMSIFLVQVSISASHGQALAEQAADALQYQVNQREQHLLSQVEAAGTSVVLSEIIANGDPAEIALEETRLSELIPNAKRVRLFPLGDAQAEPNANPPFSFTSKTMVNQVESGLEINPEAINTNDGWILSLAAPIRTPSDENIRGTLFVYLEMSALSRGLEGMLDGQLRLVQSFGDNSQDILTVGQGGVAEGRITRSLKNDNWQLAYAPSPAIVGASVSNPIDSLLPLGVLLVVAIVAVFLGVSGAIRKANQDADYLANQIASVLSGDFEHTSHYNLAAFIDLDANLQRLGPREEKRPEVERLDVKLQPKQTPREEMVDIEMIDEDDYEREVQKQQPQKPEPEPEPETEEDNTALAEIFRAYDIRGVVNDTLTAEVIRKIGLAIGTEAGEMGEQTIIVAADGRVSSPAVTKTLIEGITASGRDVIDIGTVPTPVLYYATQNSEATSGVMVTASHNPAEYNGFKVVLDGRTLVEDEIKKLYERVVSGDFSSGSGSVSETDITDDYIEAITDDVVVAQPLKLVVDCGNGVAGMIAPQLFSNLGCDVVPLYCDVDGKFPHHHPDPLKPENLQDLIEAVKAEGADLGVALDGDGDRLVAITKDGDIVWPDQLLMLFAKDVVSRNPGSDVVYDVKCTRHLNSIISSFGGRPIISRSGHSFIKAKMAETGAALGGEMSGHICFGERWFGFDDALYSTARLLEIVGSQSEGLDELLKEFPTSVSTPELHIAVDEGKKFGLVKALVGSASFSDGTVTVIDGLRVDFSDGWGLVRASNTSPTLSLRFEADDDEALARIQGIFREHLKKVDSSLDF